jgi:AmiR/NasT family two-component response regulator
LNLVYPVPSGYKCGVKNLPDKRVRVLVANGPRLMREVVLAVLADQPDIEVIGEIQDESQLAIAIEEARPDVLIIALDDSDKRAARCGFLVGRYPQMKILALAPEKNRGVFYWAVVDVRTKALESSEAGILSALREPPSLVSTLHH